LCYAEIKKEGLFYERKDHYRHFICINRYTGVGLCRLADNLYRDPEYNVFIITHSGFYLLAKIGVYDCKEESYGAVEVFGQFLDRLCAEYSFLGAGSYANPCHFRVGSIR
jgi:hypothetical protein